MRTAGPESAGIWPTDLVILKEEEEERGGLAGRLVSSGEVAMEARRKRGWAGRGPTTDLDRPVL